MNKGRERKGEKEKQTAPLIALERCPLRGDRLERRVIN